MLINLQLIAESTLFEIILVPFTITISGCIFLSNVIVIVEFTEVTAFVFSIGISDKSKKFSLIISCCRFLDKKLSGFAIKI